MLTIRASSLPRVSLCPTAAIPPREPVNWSNPYSKLGTATHRAFESFRDKTLIDLEEIADAHGVDANDLRRSFGFVMKAWHQVKDWFPAPLVEHRMEWVDTSRDIKLTGTADVISSMAPIEPDGLRIADWKTGFLEGEHENQMKGYALMACETLDKKRAHALILNSRLRSGEGWHWTLEELESWWSQLADRILAQGVPSPGSHCTHCPRWAECPAGRPYLRQAAQSLIATAEAGEDLGPSLSSSALVELAEERKLVEDACRVVQSLLKTEVASRGGRVVHRDGTRALEITEVVMREIDFEKAEPVLRPHLPRFTDCCRIGKTDLEAMIKAEAPRGQKGQAIQAMMERLDTAGAVGTVPIQVLKTTRVKE